MKKYNSVFKEGDDVVLSPLEDMFADLNNFLNDIVEITRKLESNTDFITFRKTNRKFSSSYLEFSKGLDSLRAQFAETDELADEGGLFKI